MVQVANLFIYNPTLGNEFTEGEKILAFYPDIDFNNQKFYVGLCEGLIAFAGGFTQLVKMDYIQTEKYNIGILSPEVGFFVIIMLVRDEDEDIDDQSPRIILQHILRHFYTTFTLLNSNFSTIQARESLCGLRDRLTLFLAHYIPLIPSVITSPVPDSAPKPLIEMSGVGMESDLLQVAGGLHFVSMDKIIFLTIRYFISSLNINFPHTDTLAVFHQNQLVFTQLPTEQTVALQFVLSHEPMLNYLGLNARLCTRRMSDEGYKKKLTQAEAELIPSKCIPIEAITNPSLYIYDNDDDDDDDQDDDGDNDGGDGSGKESSQSGSKKGKVEKKKPFQLPDLTTIDHPNHEHNCGLSPYITAHCCKIGSNNSTNQHQQNGQNGPSQNGQNGQNGQNNDSTTTIPSTFESSSTAPSPSILSDPLNSPDYAIISPPIYFNAISNPIGGIFDNDFDMENMQFLYHKNILKDLILFLQSGESSFDWYKRKAEEEMKREKGVKAEMLRRQKEGMGIRGEDDNGGKDGNGVGQQQQQVANGVGQRYQSYLIVLQFDETRVVLSVTSAAPTHNGDDGCGVCDGGNGDGEGVATASTTSSSATTTATTPTTTSSSQSCSNKDPLCKCARGTHPDGIGFHLEMPPPPPEENYDDNGDDDGYEDEDGENDNDNNQTSQPQPEPEPEEAPPRAPPMPPLSYNPYTGTTSLFKHFYAQLAQFVNVNVSKIISLIFPAKDYININSLDSYTYDPSLS